MPTFIALPASPARPIRHIEWSLDRPAQINRSAYTGKRTAVANPWHGIWRGRADMVPIIGEANVRAWRAFFAALKGQINTFMLPATEGPQHAIGTLTAVVVNYANTTVTAQGGGVYRVLKSGGVNTVRDAEGYSATAMNGDFAIRVDPVVGTNDLWGVSANPTADSSEVDVGLTWDPSGNVYQYYSGAFHGIAGTFSIASEYLFLQRVGSTVSILKGASASISSATLIAAFPNSLSGPVYFDSSLATTSNSADILVSYSQSFATIASGGAQGAVTATLSGAAALTAGMMATVTLPSGNKQLVVLTADIASNVITFEPPLRESAAAGAIVETANPACQVALADSAFGWSVDPGLQYGMSFAVEEVF